MIIKPSDLKQTYDFCIVGAGPVGICLALELERLNPAKTILILEFGQDHDSQNELDDTIDIDNLVNHHPPSECTNKGIGGTSLTWGGRCVNYNEIDFIPRPILLDGCTWDRSVYADCQKYIDRACELFQCGTGVFDLADPRWAHQTHVVDGFVNGAVRDTDIERWSLPTRFGATYGSHLEASQAISVCCGIKVTQIYESASDCVVECFDRSQNKPLTVNARKLVIAAGAQESTRLLLQSNRLWKEKPSSLGKYYQGHLSGKIASIVFSGDPAKTDYGFIKEGEVYVRRRFQLSSETIQQENLLNTALWLDNPLYYDPSHHNGTMSFLYLMMAMPIIGPRLAPPAIRHSVTKSKLTGVGQHLKNILFGLPSSIILPLQLFMGRYLRKRKIPGVFLHMRSNVYALHFHAEQQPIPENEMRLNQDGTRLEISYQYTDDDVKSVIRTHEILDEYLRGLGVGHLNYWYPPEELFTRIKEQSKDGIHQNGTTRIGTLPANSVVDPDLKIWGARASYVCSSSVLPTSSQANPTFFTGVLAVRLAHHLTQ